MNMSEKLESESKVGLRFFLGLTKPFRLHLLSFVGIGFVWAVFTIFRSYSLKIIIDTLATQGPDHLTWPIFMYIFSWVATEAVLRFRDFVVMYLKPYLKKHIVLYFSKRMLQYDDHYFQKHHSAALVNGLKGLYDGVEDGIYIIEELFQHFILIISALISMYIISMYFSLITVAWFVMWGVMAFFWAQKGHVLAYLVNLARMKMALNLGDLFSNISTIKTFNAAKHESEILEVSAENVAKAEYNREKVFLKIWIIQGVSFLVLALLVFYILLDGYRKKTITIGDFAMLLDLIQTVYLYLFDFAKDLSELSEVSGKLTQNLSLIFRKNVMNEGDDKLPSLKVKNGDIVLENIKYKYPNSEEDYNGFQSNQTITIKGGSTVAIVGPSGGGKSTIIKLLLRLIDPSSGRILIDGQDTSKCSVNSVREIFALVPQELGLFHRSLKDNISYGSFNASLDEIEESAHNAQISGVIEDLPLGYETIFGQQAGLSGGQKQRIMMARGLLRKAKIFLFDESTSALDAKTEFDILKSIQETTQNSTKIIIAHRLNTIKNADVIFVCNKGEIVETGTHEQLMKNQGLYYDLIHI